MRAISDDIINRLREAADLPEASEPPDMSGARYSIIEKIASGGMGTVYLAFDDNLGRKVALKVMNAADQSGEMIARMLREASIIANLEHPSIIPIHDVGRLPDDRVFYVMKLVQGNRLDQHQLNADSFSDRLGVFQRICEAMAFAHSQGVIHRDLKPENIMVGPFGEVLVMDWGIAKVRSKPLNDSLSAGQNLSQTLAEVPLGPVEEDITDAVTLRQRQPKAPESIDSASQGITDRVNPTAQGTVIGTPGYMAPEQARGDVHLIDDRTDIYALGAILYFLLTGQTVIGASKQNDGEITGRSLAPPRKLNPTIARPLEAICLKALAAAPELRYQKVEDLSADLSRYSEGAPVLAYPEGIIERTARLASKHRTAVLIVLTYVVLRVLLIFLLRP